MNELAVFDFRAVDQTVCARKLYEFLGVSTRFNDWVRRRLDEYEFMQGVDFVVLKNEYNEMADMRLTLDTAKELAMVEKTPRGREARQYFIEAEKRLKNLQPKTSLQVLKLAVDQLVEHDQRIAQLEAQTKLFASDSDYRTIRAYAREHNVSISEKSAGLVGKRAAKLCREKRLEIGKVKDERHGSVNSYPVKVLSPIFEAYRNGVID